MKRACIVCLVLLLVWLGLPPIPVSAVEAATADREDIAVLSVTVNVNTQTNRVYTELLLQNTGAKDTEITFALPEISAGIDVDSLSVKTAGGEKTEAPDGVVTLGIKAGGNAGVSYTYTPKHTLAYERAIGFDLKQLKNSFNEHIDHLEWTVDMPLYEIVLVKEIQPVLYTVEDNRISVVLEDFTINRLLDRVCLTRTTHQDMLQAEEENGNLIRRLILENYRNWYQHPEIITKNIVVTGEKIDGSATLQKVLLASKLTEEERETLRTEFDDILYQATPWTYDPEYLHVFTEELEMCLSTFALYEFLVYSLRQDYPFMGEYDYLEAPAFIAQIHHEEPVVFAKLISRYPDLDGKEIVWPVREDEPGHEVDLYEPEPEDYENIDDFLEACDIYMSACDEWDEFQEKNYNIKMVAPQGDVLGGMLPTDINEWSEVPENTRWGTRWIQDLDKSDPGISDGRIRMIHIHEDFFSGTEELQKYLDTMHVKAIVRDAVGFQEDDKLISTLSASEYWQVERYGEEYWGTRAHVLAYDGTDRYPFEEFESDIKRSFVKLDYDFPMFLSLRRGEEPLKNALSVPIITQYVGVLYPVEVYVREIEELNKQGENHSFLEGPVENAWLNEDIHDLDPGRLLDRLFADSILPKQIAEEREEALRKAAEEKRAMLAQVREELGLPTQEEAGVTMIPGLVVPERPTEEATEATTEEATETPSEAPSEAETVSATSSAEQETKTSSEATEDPIEASEAAVKTLSASTAESETEAVSAASGGKWVIPVAVLATAAIVFAVTEVVMIRKRRG